MTFCTHAFSVHTMIIEKYEEGNTAKHGVHRRCSKLMQIIIVKEAKVGMEVDQPHIASVCVWW